MNSRIFEIEDGRPECHSTETNWTASLRIESERKYLYTCLCIKEMVRVMISRKKSQVQVLVLGMMILLTLSFFVSGQPKPSPGPPPGTGDDGKNQPPQIVSIEVSSIQNIYVITIGITDEDPPESLEVEVRHEDGTTKEAKFIESRIPEGSSAPILIFEVSFALDPGSHTFTVFAEDSEGSRTEKEIIVAMLETSTPTKTDLPPQILSVEFDKDYRIIVEVTDEDPDNVIMQIEESPNLQFGKGETILISNTIKRCTFTSDPIPPELGFHPLTIVVTDLQGNKTRMEMSVVEPPRSDQPLQILFFGFDKVDNIQNKYTLTIEIIDEDPSSVIVKIEEYPNTGFKESKVDPISDDMKRSISISDPISLSRGSHTFTIAATNSQNESKEIKAAINVPGRNVSFLVVLLLVLLPAIVILAVLVSRRKPERYIDVDLPEEIEFYRRKTANLERQLSDTETQLSQTQNNLEAIQENVRNVVSERQIDDLSKIANENSPTRKDLSELLRWISLSLQNFSDLNLPNVKEDLERGIDAYLLSKTSITPQEEETYSRAQDAYEETMTELEKAHGAFDVKILELFMKRARELLEEPAPHGQKIPNYEASRNLSEWVRALLENPELRIRLRKLREAGYIDPFGIS